MLLGFPGKDVTNSMFYYSFFDFPSKRQLKKHLHHILGLSSVDGVDGTFFQDGQVFARFFARFSKRRASVLSPKIYIYLHQRFEGFVRMNINFLEQKINQTRLVFNAFQRVILKVRFWHLNFSESHVSIPS